MAIKGIFYVFAEVSNLARSKKFYGEILGWALNTDEKDVAGFAFGSGYLVIHAATDDPGSPRGSRFYAAVEVDDVDGEHARLKRLGVEVGDVTDHPWGERNFFFHDPDGHMWSYGKITRAH